MKWLKMNKLVRFNRLRFPEIGKIILPVIFTLLMLGVQASPPPSIPVLTVRFVNPVFDCPTQNYCLDVEFISDTPGQQLFGMNVRFFYDDDILEFLWMGDFAPGYDDPVAPQILTGPPGSGNTFGIAGPLEWFNGSVQLVSPSPVYLSTTEWTKLFNICFHVDDPSSLNLYEFCPSIIWDLQEEPPIPPDLEGYLPGDDGVVMTVVDITGAQDSSPTTENVVQYNWVYDTSGGLIGHPVSAICVTTICYIIPVSDWALYLGIGLMFLATIIIYRRRLAA